LRWKVGDQMNLPDMIRTVETELGAATLLLEVQPYARARW